MFKEVVFINNKLIAPRHSETEKVELGHVAILGDAIFWLASAWRRIRKQQGWNRFTIACA